MQKSISAFVEELYSGVPAEGATWLYASFPNAFIDPNRHELDIDPASLDGDWPEPLKPSPKTSSGIGQIMTELILDGRSETPLDAFRIDRWQAASEPAPH